MRRDERQALRERRLEHVDVMRRLIAGAERAGREFTKQEDRDFEEHRSAIAKIDLDLLSTSGGDGDWSGGAGFPIGERRSLLDAFRSKGWEPGQPAEIDWAEFRAFTWSGSVDDLNKTRREGVGLGFDQRYAWPAFPQTAVGSDLTSVQILRQSARTLPSAASVVRAIDAVTAKPEVANTMEAATVALKQVAAIETNIPNIILEQSGAESVVQTDLRLSLNEGLDKLVLDAVAASGFQAPGTDPLLISIRKAMSTIMANGYSPSVVVLTPANSEALDTLRTSGSELMWVFGAGRFAPGQLFGLDVRISKTVAAPFVADAAALGRMYASPVRLATFEADSGTTNRSNVRMELNAVFGVERQSAAVRIAAS
jgi:hypothetical protein